jgi:hypothetical protein
VDELSSQHKVTAWFFVGVGSGGMILLLLIGHLFEALGPRSLPIAIMLALVVALGVLVLLLGRSGRRV